MLLAAAVLAPIAARGRATAGEWNDGILAGSALAIGYTRPTVGLGYTNSATSAFITYRLVVFVPRLGMIFFRRRPHPVLLVAVIIAVVGLVLLTRSGSGRSPFGWGEVLTAGCALAFAAQVVILGATAYRHDPVRRGPPRNHPGAT